MRSEAPVLLPILRSQHQADLLAHVLLHPDREYTVTELSSVLSIPQSTVSGEVQRLTDAEILLSRSVGRSRFVRANSSSRLVVLLTELLTLTYGPHVVIGEEFDGIERIDQVLIYGSWAARYHGTPGPQPNDIDVLVVGAPNRAVVHAAAARAEDRLSRPVNPVVSSCERWTMATDPLIQEIKASPYLSVIDRQRTDEAA